MSIKTFKDFFNDLYKRNNVKKFAIKVLTNEGDNVGYYKLIDIVCVNANRYRLSTFEDFIYSICPNKDDRSTMGVIFNKPIIDVKEETENGMTVFKIFI